jgi:2-polyprenyl-3-methyl-5-hydroxy-6-metoxy-1,4-benzoquinol methylase
LIDEHAEDRRFMMDFAAGAAAGRATATPDSDDVSTHSWYHTIEFPDGSATPGQFDHRDLVPHYGLPEDLAGKRALDVGSGNGFWAFELEKRGADVTSLDIETSPTWIFLRRCTRSSSSVL